MTSKHEMADYGDINDRDYERLESQYRIHSHLGSSCPMWVDKLSLPSLVKLWSWELDPLPYASPLLTAFSHFLGQLVVWLLVGASLIPRRCPVTAGMGAADLFLDERGVSPSIARGGGHVRQEYTPN